MSETNIFGGKNPNGQYVPITEIEQEALERLATEHAFRIVIKDWGYVDQPSVQFGDSRLQFQWTMAFDRPEVPIPVEYFDLELWTHTGRHIHSKRMPIQQNGKPVQIVAGRYLRLAWDIQIEQISPELVKEVTKVRGLTTRRGNMKLDPLQRKVLADLEKQQALWKAIDATKISPKK